MRVLVVHQHVSDTASADERDVLVQRDAVSKTLARLGHEAETFACNLDLNALAIRVRARRPDVVFNLVESLDGVDALQMLVPAVLEAHGIPYTGSSAAAILTSGEKTRAKRALRDARLPTPLWHSASSPPAADFEAGQYILKPVAEHASLGMTDADVIDAISLSDLLSRLEAKAGRLGRECFAEQYIDGREFNVSLLAGARGPEMLPPAEIRFEGFAIGKPRIVGHDAKWNENSFEYRATVRAFETAPGDAGLIAQLRDLSIRCWNVFELSGYARVDFRIDHAGRPFILEANANPCLSPDAGFAAAAEQASLRFDEIIARILGSARSRVGWV